MRPCLRGQFGESVAARCIKLAADTFEPAVVERVVGFLGDLAADGAALEDPAERIHGGRRLIVGRHRPWGVRSQSRGFSGGVISRAMVRRRVLPSR